MKFLIQSVAVLVLALLLSWLMPWWSAVLAGLVGGFLLGGHNLRDFGAGFVGVFALWFFYTLWVGVLGGSPVAGRVGDLIPLFGGLSGFGLVFFTALAGGLAGALGSLTGGQVRKVIAEGKKARA